MAGIFGYAAGAWKNVAPALSGNRAESIVGPAASWHLTPGAAYWARVQDIKIPIQHGSSS